MVPTPRARASAAGGPKVMVNSRATVGALRSSRSGPVTPPPPNQLRRGTPPASAHNALAATGSRCVTPSAVRTATRINQMYLDDETAKKLIVVARNEHHVPAFGDLELDLKADVTLSAPPRITVAQAIDFLFSLLLQERPIQDPLQFFLTIIDEFFPYDDRPRATAKTQKAPRAETLKTATEFAVEALHELENTLWTERSQLYEDLIELGLKTPQRLPPGPLGMDIAAVTGLQSWNQRITLPWPELESFSQICLEIAGLIFRYRKEIDDDETRENLTTQTSHFLALVAEEYLAQMKVKVEQLTTTAVTLSTKIRKLEMIKKQIKLQHQDLELLTHSRNQLPQKTGSQLEKQRELTQQVASFQKREADLKAKLDELRTIHGESKERVAQAQTLKEQLEALRAETEEKNLETDRLRLKYTATQNELNKQKDNLNKHWDEVKLLLNSLRQSGEHIRQQQAAGAPGLEAIALHCRVRLNPNPLTTLDTFLEKVRPPAPSSRGASMISSRSSGGAVMFSDIKRWAESATKDLESATRQYRECRNRLEKDRQAAERELRDNLSQTTAETNAVRIEISDLEHEVKELECKRDELIQVNADKERAIRERLDSAREHEASRTAQVHNSISHFNNHIDEELRNFAEQESKIKDDIKALIIERERCINQYMSEVQRNLMRSLEQICEMLPSEVTEKFRQVQGEKAGELVTASTSEPLEVPAVATDPLAAVDEKDPALLAPSCSGLSQNERLPPVEEENRSDISETSDIVTTESSAGGKRKLRDSVVEDENARPSEQPPQNAGVMNVLRNLLHRI